MKSFILIFLMAVLSVGNLIAQSTGSISVFAENGERFWLILDGNRINQDAKANVRVEGLKKAWYRSKIIFEDESIEALDANVALQDVESNNLMDVTYVVKKTNKGKWVLRVSSFSEVAPSGGESQVLKYDDASGQVSNQSATDENVKTTVTTTTTTKVQNPDMESSDITINTDMGEMGNVSIKTSIPGMSMNMNTNMTVTETTTTQTQTTSSNPAAPAPKASPAPSTACNNAMSSGDFSSAKASISNQSFTDSQMKVAKQILKSNCLNVNQVIEIMNIFSYEESKLDFAKAAYSKTVDKGNYYKINDAFTYSGSIDELNEFLESQE